MNSSSVTSRPATSGGTTAHSTVDKHLYRQVENCLELDLLINSEPGTTPQVPTFPHCPVDNPTDASQFLDRPEMAYEMAHLHPQLADTYSRVRAGGVPNYRGAQVPLKHSINIQEWRDRVHIFKDPSLPDMLSYGFPSRYLGKGPPSGTLSNHASATRNPSQVRKFLEKECALQAMLGPFPVRPFTEWFRNNPVMTRPKRNSDELRVILDLSFPVRASVNSGIQKNILDGAEFKLKTPEPPGSCRNDNRARPRLPYV